MRAIFFLLNTYIQIGLNYRNMSKEKELEELELNGEVSKEESEEIQREEEIAKKAEVLKKKHSTKKIFFIEVEDEDTGEWVGGYLRKPNLKEYSLFASIAPKDKISALKTLMTNIFLDGDERLLSDDDYFLSAMGQLEDIVNVQASRIKKY